MSMHFKRLLPIPKDIREEMPLRADLVEAKRGFDAQVAAIFRGEDSRRALIIGPCSADREDSVLEYMDRLAKLQEQVRDRLLIIRASTPTSPAPRAPATRACYIIPIRRQATTCSRASRPFAACTCV